MKYDNDSYNKWCKEANVWDKSSLEKMFVKEVSSPISHSFLEIQATFLSMLLADIASNA